VPTAGSVAGSDIHKSSIDNTINPSKIQIKKSPTLVPLVQAPSVGDRCSDL
jgi:hypothetical protein